jgi:pimeloyl-ACP methyl ester carboxylesterase
MTILEWIGVVAIVYLAICLVAYYTQEFFLFHPEKLDKDFKYQFAYPHYEFFLDTEDGHLINGLHFQLPKSKGVVFYFKGNTRSIKGWGKYARDFLSKGFDFFVIDYRGFGKSTGRRSERNIELDTQIAYNYLKNHYAESEIVLYGRSIGSGFAASLAASNHPNKLILDSPYYSMYHLAKIFLPFLPIASILNYHILTYQHIQNVKCPIFIIHGTSDKLIPYRHALKLSQLNFRSNLIRIKGGGHNNLPEYSAYHHHIYEILNDSFEEPSFFEEIF